MEKNYKEFLEADDYKIPKRYKPVVIITRLSLINKSWKGRKATGVDCDKINRQLKFIRDSVTDLCNGLLDAGQQLTADLLRPSIKTRYTEPIYERLNV